MSASDLARRVASLTPEKRALFLGALEQQRKPAHGHIPRRAPDAGTAPLTYAQERIWIVERLVGASPLYNLPLFVRLQQAVPVDAIDRAFEALVARHEALRTVFLEHDGGVWQRVEAPYSPELVYVDLRPRAADRRWPMVAAEAEREWATPFDVGLGPVIRMTALQVADDDWAIVATLHHLVADAWSLTILERELQALVEAFGRGTPPELPPLPMQFADYAAWQRSPEEERARERHRGYWERQLADAPAGVPLPWRVPRVSTPSVAGAIEGFTIPAQVAEQLKALAGREHATPFMVLLAAFFAFLARVSGERDLRLLSPIADRRERQTEPIVGLFLNILTLRANVDGERPFVDLLADVRQMVLDAYEHQEYPVELVRGAGDPQTRGSTPVCQVAFGLQTALTRQPVAFASNGGASTIGTAKFDLSVILAESTDGYAGACEYRTALFDGATIRSWIAQYTAILEAIAYAPETTVGRLPRQRPGEHAALLKLAIGPPDTPAEWRAFPAMIEAHASQRGEALAVDGRHAMTYRELHRAANALAHHLCAEGLRTGDRVAVLLDRTPEWVVAFLAILRAGGVYVPLDPGYPRERLAFIVDDAEPSFLLVSGHTQELLPAGHARRLRVDEAVAWSDAQTEAAPVSLRPQDPAYQIYTSGSTGTPKGAVLTHAGLGRLADAQGACFGPAPGDRVLPICSVSFDASIFELSMALAHGATLCLHEGTDVAAGPDMADLLAETRASILTVPPAMLAALPVRALPHLHTIVAAGERCPADLVDAWQPGRRFFNAYGPTECTVWATVHRCRAGEGDPPIGTPIHGTRAYIVDRWGNLCPTGTPGEIWIGGAKVGAGYWKRAELTAARFGRDPFVPDDDARVYKTGDRARARPDGAIEFLGRIDRQVKVHGCRIEPGEMEAALERLPMVSRAAVVVTGNGDADARLEGYVVPSSATDEASIREALAAALPRYMLPGRIALVDALPRTPNGKIDYGALAARPIEKPPDRDLRPLAGAVEETLAAIWREVLGVDEVGANSGFLALGGHSLLLGRLFVRIREELGIQPSMKDLFEATTLRDMAGRISRVDPAAAAETPIRPQARKRVSLDELRRATGTRAPDGDSRTWPRDLR